MKYLKARYDYPVVDIKAFHELFPNSYGNKPKKKKIIIKGLTLLDETSEEEFETLEKGRYIKLSSLSGNEGNILTDITNRTLYTRHIPDSYASGCHLNAARFVMITAAFEWEFKRLYPGGITKSDKTQKIENEAAEAIQKLIDGSTTRALKKKYEFLKKSISFSNLQSEIIYTGNELNEIIGAFGKQLYALNDVELIYSEMGKRIADQRNNFAHGNLDIDLIDDSILDLIYLERIVYAMQLKYHGVDDENIKRAINDLFRCGFII